MLSARNINNFKIEFDAARLLDEQAFGVEDARTRVQPGDVLLTIVGSIGRVAVVPATAPRFTLQRSVAVLKPVGMNSKYLAHALASPGLQQWLNENAKGTAQKGVYLKTLGSAKVPVAPSDEQNRIVEKLEELLSDLDAGMAELKAAQKKLQQYRQSLLKAAVEGELTAAWRESRPAPEETGADLLARILRERRARWEAQQIAKFEAQGKASTKGWQGKYPEPVEPENESQTELPTGWVWASVNQLSEIQGGIQKQPTRTPISNKYPFLRVANVARGELKLDDVHEIELFAGEPERLLLQKGDLLVVEGNGSLSEIGRCALWDGSIERATHQNHLIRVRPLYMNGEFMESWFNSAGGVAHMTRLAATTSGLYTLSVGKISKIPVPVPPLSEQRAAMELLRVQLEELERQEAFVATTLQQSTAQRQNLLRAAFAGQLVPQDPDDEPASVLLERIRAKRLQSPKQTKTRASNARKEIKNMVNRLIDVLAEEADWLSAQEAFRRCGVTDGAPTDQIEQLYAELRALSKARQIAVEPLRDEEGRKVGDQLRLLRD